LAAKLLRAGHTALAYYWETPKDCDKALAARQAVAADVTRRGDFPEEYLLFMGDILERWLRGEVRVLVSTVVLLVGMDHK